MKEIIILKPIMSEEKLEEFKKAWDKEVRELNKNPTIWIEPIGSRRVRRLEFWFIWHRIIICHKLKNWLWRKQKI